MNTQKYLTILRYMLRGVCVFTLLESIFYASGIRTYGVEQYWPQSAIVMVKLFIWLWASICLFVAMVLYYLQKYLGKSKQLLLLLTLPTVVHIGVLIYLSFTPYNQVLPAPNLYVWVPSYSWCLRTEAGILFLIASYIWYGKWKKYF